MRGFLGTMKCPVNALLIISVFTFKCIRLKHGTVQMINSRFISLYGLNVLIRKIISSPHGLKLSREREETTDMT